MPTPDPDRIRSFATPQAFYDWLAGNHGEPELWLRIYKKASGVASVTWDEAVTEALCWGWIDGIKKSYDAESFLQRFCPRKKNALWSMINRRKAEELISAGRMAPQGLACVEEARANGRWDNAYLGASEAETPPDFLAALDARPAAKAGFDRLNSSQRYAVYFRLQTAPSAKARAARFAKLLEQVEGGGI